MFYFGRIALGLYYLFNSLLTHNRISVNPLVNGWTTYLILATNLRYGGKILLDLFDLLSPEILTEITLNSSGTRDRLILV
ncbi:MAG TPA: hypothetical protein VIL31_08710 [Cyclobacteriaceae bacterium]